MDFNCLTSMEPPPNHHKRKATCKAPFFQNWRRQSALKGHIDPKNPCGSTWNLDPRNPCFEYGVAPVDYGFPPAGSQKPGSRGGFDNIWVGNHFWCKAPRPRLTISSAAQRISPHTWWRKQKPGRELIAIMVFTETVCPLSGMQWMIQLDTGRSLSACVNPRRSSTQPSCIAWHGCNGFPRSNFLVSLRWRNIH